MISPLDFLDQGAAYTDIICHCMLGILKKRPKEEQMRFNRQERRPVHVVSRQANGGRELMVEMSEELPNLMGVIPERPEVHEDPGPKGIREMLEELKGKSKDA